MEWVNEYISLTSQKSSGNDHSFCIASENEEIIHFRFQLYANDCLFDLNDNYTFDLQISKSYFSKYKEPFEISFEKQNLCCNTQSRLLEIINCKLEGIHRKVFLESKILLLLYETQKNHTLIKLNCDECEVLNKPVNIDKILEAKKYIIENLSGNLTIPVIVRTVGTNECYLKKGFKEVFNQTIYEFIQENRMLKAKFLLNSPAANITEIAYKVGYSSLSSFSQSYKKFFGISPTHQIKKFIPNN